MELHWWNGFVCGMIACFIGMVLFGLWILRQRDKMDGDE